MIVEMRTYKVKRGTRPKILEVLRTKTFDELKRIGVKCWGPYASVEDETTIYFAGAREVEYNRRVSGRKPLGGLELRARFWVVIVARQRETFLLQLNR